MGVEGEKRSRRLFNRLVSWMNRLKISRGYRRISQKHEVFYVSSNRCQFMGRQIHSQNMPAPSRRRKRKQTPYTGATNKYDAGKLIPPITKCYGWYRGDTNFDADTHQYPQALRCITQVRHVDFAPSVGSNISMLGTLPTIRIFDRQAQ